MIAAPYWSGLDISISVHNEARVLQVNVPLDKFFDLTSIDYYEDAFKSNQSSVKALLVCNPHNPLGRCYGKRVLQGLLDFCSRNNLHFISDELYALSIHKLEEENGAPPRFVSALSLTGTSNLVHVVYSLSKDFGCSGIRMVCSLSFGKRRVLIEILGSCYKPAQQCHLSWRGVGHPWPGLNPQQLHRRSEYSERKDSHSICCKEWSATSSSLRHARAVPSRKKH